MLKHYFTYLICYRVNYWFATIPRATLSFATRAEWCSVLPLVCVQRLLPWVCRFIQVNVLDSAVSGGTRRRRIWKEDRLFQVGPGGNAFEKRTVAGRFTWDPQGNRWSSTPFKIPDRAAELAAVRRNWRGWRRPLAEVRRGRLRGPCWRGAPPTAGAAEGAAVCQKHLTVQIPRHLYPCLLLAPVPPLGSSFQCAWRCRSSSVRGAGRPLIGGFRAHRRTPIVRSTCAAARKG